MNISLIYFNRTLWGHGEQCFSVQLVYTWLIVLYFSFLEVQNLNLGMNQLWQKKNKKNKKEEAGKSNFAEPKNRKSGTWSLPDYEEGTFYNKAQSSDHHITKEVVRYWKKKIKPPICHWKYVINYYQIKISALYIEIHPSINLCNRNPALQTFIMILHAMDVST